MEAAISFDRVAHEYDATRHLPEALQEFALRRVARIVGGGTLLEAGTGTGRFSAPLTEMGVRVTGCDVSEKMLARALHKGLRSALLGDLRRLPFRDGTFDVGMTNHVLHLVRDWPAALAEICRVVRRTYLSVLQWETERVDLGRAYHRLAARLGAVHQPWGLAERKLARRLPPDKVWRSRTLRGRIPADPVLEQLQARTMSSQWSIPERVHSTVMRELRGRYGGEEVENEIRVEVAVWDLLRVREFAERAGPPAVPGRSSRRPRPARAGTTRGPRATAGRPGSARRFGGR